MVKLVRSILFYLLMSKKLCRYLNSKFVNYLKVHATCVRTIFFPNFFYGSFNTEFREDFRHSNKYSVTSKSSLLPKRNDDFTELGGRKGLLIVPIWLALSLAGDDGTMILEVNEVLTSDW